ncbi:MAG: hypothetical protein NTV44_05855 [Firmicutes bacterium]|nr:hypothetical protein [Bacillota bacterium]
MKIKIIAPLILLMTLSSCGITYDLSSLSSSSSSGASISESSSGLTSEATSLCTTSQPTSMSETSAEPSSGLTSGSEFSSEEEPYVIYAFSSLSGADLINPDYAHWVGRTTYDAAKSANMMYYTGTGFDVRILGTGLTINFYLQKTSPGTPDDNYVQITVDDEVAPMEGQVLVVKSTQKILSINGLTYGYHTIHLLRRNEPIDGNLGVSSMATDGHFCEAPVHTGLKFSIVGASGISGHGNLGVAGQPWTTANSSSLHSFGFLTARMFDGESEFVSASGWGVLYGYNAGNASGTGENIVKAFDKVGINDTDRLVNETYDVSKFIPDYVIVNAGGNDYNAYINNQTGAAKTTAINNFKASVNTFVTYLHTNYPNVKILWTVGSISTGNGSWASAVISDLDPTGFYVKTVIIPGAGDGGDPMGADGHASVTTHIRTAEILATTIETWSGITRVRDNIIYPS